MKRGGRMWIKCLKNKGITLEGNNSKQSRKYVSKNIGCNILVVG
jgi:hypothetical protein